MDKQLFQNRYRVPTTRVKWHDYRCGIYFVTICTSKGKCFFGNIVASSSIREDAKMELSELGKYVEWKITDLPNHHENVEVPLWVVMPNHLHLIVVINDAEKDNVRDERNYSIISPQKQSLASIMRGLKSATTKYAHENEIEFAWQSRYYEHIVRNQDELNRIAEYIETNVAKWELDKMYVKL